MAIACVEIQSQTAGRGRGACIDVQTPRHVVHQAAVCRLAVDLYLQGVGADRQARHAHKGRAGRVGLQTRPGARQGSGGLGAAELLACDGQAELHPRQTHAGQAALEGAISIEATVQAGICAEPRAAQCEQVNLHLTGRTQYAAIARQLRIAQGDGVAALFKGQIAFDAKKAEGVYGEVARGAGDFTQASRQVQRQGAGVANRAGWNNLVLCRIIHQGVVSRMAGDLHVDSAGAHRQARHANEVGTGSARFDCCPFAGRLADCGGFLGLNRHCEVHAAQVQAGGS